MTAAPASASRRGGSFHLATFGCQMNVNDSAWLAASLAKRGYVAAGMDEADIVLINTCSVREKPERKVHQLVRRIIAGRGKNIRIAVLGCVAQQCGRELLAEYPQVSLVAGGDNIGNVPDAIQRIMEDENCRLELLNFSPAYAEREFLADAVRAPSAFVNIMQGCDNFCAYCIVPFTRGRQKSRDMDAILEECRARLSRGTVELVLLGQNVNAWGRDRERKDGLAFLLEKIAVMPGLRRLRFITSHPKDFDEDLVDCVGRHSVIAPVLHLPLQSGSDRVLKMMGRGYSAWDYLRLVKKIREARPDMEFATDLITGFPGETEEDFQETLAMMRECGFISSFSFCYSDRPGTRSMKLGGKVDNEVKLERLGRLQALQDSISARWLSSRVGAAAEVLLEKRSPKGEKSWSGHDPWSIAVNVEFGDDEDHAGEFVAARIKGAKKHSLVAVPEKGF